MEMKVPRPERFQFTLKFYVSSFSKFSRFMSIEYNIGKTDRVGAEAISMLGRLLWLDGKGMLARGSASGAYFTYL